MEVSDARRPRALDDENRKRKKLLAEIKLVVGCRDIVCTMFAVFFVAINLFTDLLTQWLDPRTRDQERPA